MIDPKIKAFLLSQSDSFVKKAKDVAIVSSDHNLAHAKLLLSQYQYSRVPVLDQNKAFVGVIGLNEIVNYELAHELSPQTLQEVPVQAVVNTKIPTVQQNFTLEELLYLLISEPFIPVLQGNTFVGIIVRQEILSAFNALAHDFTKKYEIIERN
ncbi:CBS domain-containing protein [Lactococcus hircilactis]|uniref:CBS domain-containing protein n=1 Tax=Lactococcus hircilactis TaxID=1494462 RepID=A0A7X2D0W9_9LACT|nr:cyclic-di-AMP-binding protein CbpB [Lactococcus hircilactis]MQW38500.1 CBS domain-containing protein [Lactococcus hircilactis]